MDPLEVMTLMQSSLAFESIDLRGARVTLSNFEYFNFNASFFYPLYNSHFENRQSETAENGHPLDSRLQQKGKRR